MTVMISFFLSGTVFGLYPIACVILGLCALSDKYLLLNFHQISKNFNDEFHMVAFGKYIPITIILHILVSQW